MITASVIQLFKPTPPTKSHPFKDLMKRIGSARLARVFAKPSPDVPKDPYLLVLLADQEIGAGREEQAKHLVDAAYDLFDRRGKANVYKLHLAG